VFPKGKLDKKPGKKRARLADAGFAGKPMAGGQEGRKTKIVTLQKSSCYISAYKCNKTAFRGNRSAENAEKTKVLSSPSAILPYKRKGV
jgi:hypothetical protein